MSNTSTFASATPDAPDTTASKIFDSGTLAPVKEQAQAVGEEIRELGRRSKDVAMEEFGAIRERGEDVVEGAKQRANHLGRALGDSVRERPLQSMLWAAGAGLVIGFLVRR
jgi:ElaB/YqjD/DUF883 family membrane-anchored ribosome-binding protein